MDTADVLRRRARVIRAIRTYFDALGFIEVDTWVAITAPAPEPHIETPAVRLQTPQGQSQRFLQPSPELQMKRLLVHAPSIYQIAPVFRQNDLSTQHRPEFRMLEWYRRDASWHALLDDCEAVIRASAIAANGTMVLPNSDIDLSKPFLRISMEDAFLEHAGFSILQAIDSPTLQYRLDQKRVHYCLDDSWNDLFQRAFFSLVEPHLARSGKPFFLTDYPAPLQMYAQLSRSDPRACERFEFFVGAMELANGYGELVQPQLARMRFGADERLRERAKMQRYPQDERYFDALGQLPPSAGIALGLDRLLMLVLGMDDIDKIVGIPWSQA